MSLCAEMKRDEPGLTLRDRLAIPEWRQAMDEIQDGVAATVAGILEKHPVCPRTPLEARRHAKAARQVMRSTLDSIVATDERGEFDWTAVKPVFGWIPGAR